MTECKGISSSELTRLAGITYRQLDHWCRVGYIEPHNHTGRENTRPGTGHKRCWAPAEVAKVQRFNELTAGGLEHERAWLMLQQPEPFLVSWIDHLAKLYYQLTGEQIVLKTYLSTPVDNSVEGGGL